MNVGNAGFSPEDTIASLAADFSAGRVSASDLVSKSVTRAALLRQQGSFALTRLWPDEALASAQIEDRLLNAGVPVPSLMAGLPVTVKDLCDVRGDVTQSGSAAFADHLPASRDAVCVSRLRAAGAVIIGKSNMSEFAFTNTGENRTFGSPCNPVDPDRVAGGSSSGAAASVADGSVIAALGTDTGGSIRSPAALCGLAGFKPTARRISAEGVIPLSLTLDSIGPIARSINCCAIMDAVLAGEAWRPLTELPLAGLFFGVPTTVVLDDLDPEVAEAFSKTLRLLSQAGATITEFAWPEIELARWRTVFTDISHSEVYASHGALVRKKASVIDPDVVRVIESGREIDFLQRSEALAYRARSITGAADVIGRFSAVLMPTVPILAPRFSDLKTPESASRLEFLIGRNNEIANFHDCCAATLPCQQPGELPVGLQVLGKAGDDRRILATASAIEKGLRQHWLKSR